MIKIRYLICCSIILFANLFTASDRPVFETESIANWIDRIFNENLTHFCQNFALLEYQACGLEEIIFSHDGRYLAARFYSEYVVWDIESRNIIYKNSLPVSMGVKSIAFSKDNRNIVALVEEDESFFCVLVCDLQQVRPVEIPLNHFDPFKNSDLSDKDYVSKDALILSPDGNSVVFESTIKGDSSYFKKLWLVNIKNVEDFRLLLSNVSLKDISHTSFSMNGKFLIVQDRIGNTYVQSIEYLDTLVATHCIGVTRIIRAIVSSNGEDFGLVGDRFSMVYNKEFNAQPIWYTIFNQKMNDVVGCAAFNSNSDYFFMFGFYNNTLLIYDLKNDRSESIGFLTYKFIHPKSIAISPDDRFIAIGCQNGKVYFRTLGLHA